MRLNRVLQITAGMSVALAAIVFTISCSDGESGNAGASCTIEETAVGYDVKCGGAKVGELLNPAAESQGPAGPAGPAGPNGASCIVDFSGQSETGAIPIKCGGVSQGFLDGCGVISGEATVTAGSPGTIINISCGSTGVALCKTTSNQVVFEPAFEECRSTGPVRMPSYCGEEETLATQYYPSTSYCGYSTAADMKAGKLSILPLCPKIERDKQPNNETETEWKDEYCRIYVAPDLEKTKWNSAVSEITYKVETPEDCDGTPIKLNTLYTGYNYEYCGWAAEKGAIATKRTKVGWDKKDATTTGIIVGPTAEVKAAGALCDDGQGPYEHAFNGGYCQARSDIPVLNKRVEGSAFFCGTKRDASARVNERSWQHQYCGYKTATANAKTVEQVANLTTQAPMSNREAFKVALECAVLAPNSELPEGSTAEKTAAFEYCHVKIVDTDTLVTLSSPALNVQNFGCPAGAKINEKAWKGEYCGWTNASARTKTIQKPANRNCGLLAPNSGDEAPANAGEVEYCQMSPDGKTLVLAKPSDNDCTNGTSKLNENEYKADYCGYATATAKVKTVINFTKNTAFTAEGALACGALKPNAEQPAGANGTEQAKNFQYCQVGADGKMVLAKPSDNDCGATTQLNLGSWKGEYCGYNGYGTTAKAKVKIVPTVAQGGPDCGVIAPNSKTQPETAADVEYCTEESYKAGLTIATVGITASTGTGDNRVEANSCGKKNEGGWKNEYCLFDNSTDNGPPGNPAPANNGFLRVVQCGGGTVVNPGYSSAKVESGGLNPAEPTKEDTRVCLWPDDV